LGLIKGVKGPLRKLKGGKVGLKVNHPTGPYTQKRIEMPETLDIFSEPFSSWLYATTHLAISENRR
jgi:hypothetical protein